MRELWITSGGLIMCAIGFPNEGRVNKIFEEIMTAHFSNFMKTISP